MERLLFQEEQRHNQWWLWLILMSSFLVAVVPLSYGIYSQEVLDKPFGNHPMSTTGLVIVDAFSILLMVFILLFIARLRLNTRINNEGIWYCYPPIIRKWKKVDREEIERYEIRIYRATREFGGYGNKNNWKYGSAYIISGNVGLQLYLKNGKKLLLGTQKKQAIQYAMEKMMEQDKL